MVCEGAFVLVALSGELPKLGCKEFSGLLASSPRDLWLGRPPPTEPLNEPGAEIGLRPGVEWRPRGRMGDQIQGQNGGPKSGAWLGTKIRAKIRDQNQGPNIGFRAVIALDEQTAHIKQNYSECDTCLVVSSFPSYSLIPSILSFKYVPSPIPSLPFFSGLIKNAKFCLPTSVRESFGDICLTKKGVPNLRTTLTIYFLRGFLCVPKVCSDILPFVERLFAGDDGGASARRCAYPDMSPAKRFGVVPSLSNVKWE